MLSFTWGKKANSVAFKPSADDDDKQDDWEEGQEGTQVQLSKRKQHWRRHCS